MKFDAELASFATARQLEYLEATETQGSVRKACEFLGVDRRTLQRGLDAVRKKAALRGWSPQHDMNKIVPDGYLVKGVSTYYDKEGVKAGQWVKSTADAVRQAEIQKAAIEALCEEIPRLGTLAPVLGTLGHLCNVVTFTDSHVGMLAWHKEGGADWDLEIAERVLVGCFEQMIAGSPRAATCLVSQLGDFIHTDGLVPVTPANAHVLDVAGRFPQMVRTAVRVLRRIVDMALVHHERVVLLMAEGNHDPASSVWLRAMFRALYENEPRVEVIDSELPYYVYQHGNTMLAFHHGHLSKPVQLPILFAAQYPKVWGSATKRYCHTGHRHHVEEKEYSGMTVIQHPTLAARDAYAARGGWQAERSITGITYSDRYGQVARNTVYPEMLA